MCFNEEDTSGPNTNCLQDMRCPECGSYGPFWISVTILGTVLMSDAGTIEERIDSTDWEDNDSCRCADCGYDGVAKDFYGNY